MNRSNSTRCLLCDGYGYRQWFKHTTTCKACDGAGRIPHMTDWRPSEPCAEATNGR